MKGVPVYEAKVSKADIIINIILVMLVIGWFTIWGAIRRRFIKLQIFKDRIVVRDGKVKKETTTFPINKVQSVWIEQNWLGRILNYGTIHIETAGRNACILPKMSKPDK